MGASRFLQARARRVRARICALERERETARVSKRKGEGLQYVNIVSTILIYPCYVHLSSCPRAPARKVAHLGTRWRRLGGCRATTDKARGDQHRNDRLQHKRPAGAMAMHALSLQMSLRRASFLKESFFPWRESILGSHFFWFSLFPFSLF